MGLEGEPTLEYVTDDMHGEVTTSIGIASRVLDIIKAPAGFITVAEMPKPKYCVKPMPEYL